MQPPTFQESVNRLKRDVSSAVTIALKQFRDETGMQPSGITLDFVDLSTHDQKVFGLQDVNIEFKV